MLDVRYVADHPDEVKEALARRSPALVDVVEGLAGLSDQRRALVHATEMLQAKRNQANQEMAKLAKGGDKSLFAERRAELKQISDQLKGEEQNLSKVEAELAMALMGVPNTPDVSVPDGTGEPDNRLVRSWGNKPSFDFEPKPHWDLGTELGILDFERAAKLSGARFSVLLGAGARLGRSLIQFMLNLHTEEHGYLEMLPPFLVKGEALRGSGQLPKFEADLFKTHRHDPDDDSALYLIPTAEVPLTGFHMDEILDASDLPLAYTAYTPCFRSEAGSYGKDVRGLIRQHQFDKVELMRFCAPDEAESQLELLTGHAETVLQRLGLHYRVMELCAGDLGFSAKKTYDLEVWLPSQNAYREISSCSWFGDFQARRGKTRFRRQPKAKPELVHTLNGSGLAVGRTLVAILEQYQDADGSVRIPEVLQSMLGKSLLKKPR